MSPAEVLAEQLYEAWRESANRTDPLNAYRLRFEKRLEWDRLSKGQHLIWYAVAHRALAWSAVMPDLEQMGATT